MKLTGEHGAHYFELSTGRIFASHEWVLGLSERHPGELFNGYDGTVWTEDEDGQPQHQLSFTPDERTEIAEYMIALWRAWGEKPELAPCVAATT